MQTVVQSKSLDLQDIEGKEMCQEGKMISLNEEAYSLLVFLTQHTSISEVQSRSLTMMTVLTMDMSRQVERNISLGMHPLKDHICQNIHFHLHQS